MTTTATATIFDYLPFTATREQANALYQLADFVAADCTEDVFITQGAAGTGKTSLIKALVDYLETAKINYHLAAPTGRAAKILGQTTNVQAHTIHHLLYTTETIVDDRVMLTRRPVTSKPYSIYVIDESSIISDKHETSGQFVATNSLLYDLLDHVKATNKRNKLVFIGDRYQLAPINESMSPALQADYLLDKYKLSVRKMELSEVKRQATDSPVLNLATKLRRYSDGGLPLVRLDVPRLQSVGEALRHYVKLYDSTQPDNVLLIACTNRDVNWLNNAVRQRLGLSNQSILANDLMTVHENWTDGKRLIAKGEMGRVLSVDPSAENIDGLVFRRVQLTFTSTDGQPFSIWTQVLENVLLDEKGQVDRDRL